MLHGLFQLTTLEMKHESAMNNSAVFHLLNRVNSGGCNMWILSAS